MGQIRALAVGIAGRYDQSPLHISRIRSPVPPMNHVHDTAGVIGTVLLSEAGDGS